MMKGTKGDRSMVNKKSMTILVTIFIFIILILYTFWLLLPVVDTPPPKSVIWIHVSIESHNNSWEITIDSISYQGESISSIQSETVRLRFELREPPPGHDESIFGSRWQIFIQDMRNTWSEEYTSQYDEDITIKMNRVIWNDLDGDDRLSVGDTFVIEKEGGEDWQISPGDDFYIFGYSEDRTMCYTSHKDRERIFYIKLPNTTENQTYE